MFPSSGQCPLCGAFSLNNFSKNAADIQESKSINLYRCCKCLFEWQYPICHFPDQSVEFFEKSYQNSDCEYFGQTGAIKRCQFYADYIQSLNLSKGRHLDIGGGIGALAYIMTQRGWSSTVADPALSPMEIPHEISSKISWIKGGEEEIPAGKYYDLITAIDVIEHVEDPEAFLNTLKNHLAPNGTLIIETGNITFFWKLFRNGAQDWMYQQDHRWYFGFPSMIKMLDKVGLEKFDYSHIALRQGALLSNRFSYLKYLIKHPFKFFKVLNTLYSIRMTYYAFVYPENATHIFTIACRKKV